MKKTRRPEPNRSQKNDYEARILAAAAEIFLEKGYEETATADIARRARISKRELYSNFTDKRDILAAVITQLQSEIQGQAEMSWSSTGDLRSVLIQVGTHILEFINSERFGKLFRIVVAESFRDPVSAQKFYLLGPGTGRKEAAAFMRRHMKAGHLRNGNSMQAADDFLDLVISSHRLTAVVLGQSREAFSARTHVRHAVDVFLNYHAPAKPDGYDSIPRTQSTEP